MNHSGFLAPGCRMCGNHQGNVRYPVREHMLGLDTEFEYVACASCGARSIVEAPADMSPYYPPTYQSFERRQISGLKARVRRWRNAGYFAAALSPKRILSRLLHDHASGLPSLARVRPGRDARILDVGSGAGGLVEDLGELGFRSLTAIDPFLPDGAERAGPPVTIRRANLEDLAGERFDVVMLHHVLEHRLDPVETLRQVSVLLAPGGTVLLRVPLADSWAAEHYGPLWVQHDAPRHLVVPTSRSMALAAEAAGLRIVGQWRDSTPFQVWGSEAYGRGLRLEDVDRGRRPGIVEWLRSDDERRERRLARRLNREERGDQGAFVLRRTGG